MAAIREQRKKAAAREIPGGLADWKGEDMEKFHIINEEARRYSMGAVRTQAGVHFSAAFQGESCSLVLFRKGKPEIVQEIPFSAEYRIGDVWNMTVAGNFDQMEYCYRMDGRLMEDAYGKQFIGREVWGDEENWKKVLHAAVSEAEYDWEGDRPPQIPYEQCIIYRLHPRGFTRHASSKVKAKGTFAGIIEKIPYLQELGINVVELLPSVEFQEVMLKEEYAWDPKKKEEKPNGRLNYWGFVPGLSFASKASYASKKEKHPGWEFKDLVKALHRAGMELIMDMFFDGREPDMQVLEALRFWAGECHVDGFHLIGFVPARLLASDPYLSRVKLFYQSWEGIPVGRHRHLAEYNDGFANAMRQFLKGDENQLNTVISNTRRNPGGFGVVNYIANTNGFTMMDNVCYDTKHNEANGENNQDGTDYNYSWNCGVEGPCRKKKVMDMRSKQIRNSWLLTFLCQGTPLILAGDEFGNSKNGNNNAYCQDNEISWLNWSQAKSNRDILEFARAVIRFRKKHPVFHMEKEPKGLDYLSCGMPDVSYHGTKAWRPEFEHFRRQLGIMYCGKYAKTETGEDDDYFFVAYNMHWEPHEFSLPNLPKGMLWHVAFDTDAREVNGVYPEGEEKVLEKQKFFMVQARSIVVFIGKAGTPDKYACE